ncbi:M56 family metallopeptidase [Pseudohongiella sp. O18]|uniref:M56 family metallopeptidase n=1 Tax=Pseudohongiella sp. O18 TaxID=2904248 RepID=UPI001F192C6B|nr:M56 family metallopeptidase [Pseudohongiella sp. O18]
MEQMIWIMDLVGKSVVLVVVFALAASLFASRKSAESHHLLWLGCMFCLALMPVMPVVVPWMLSQETSAAAAGALFELKITSGATQQGSQLTLIDMMAGLYVIVAMLLAMRLGVAALRLRRLTRSARMVTDPRVTAETARLATELQIARLVSVRVGRDLDSPVSFGLFRPQILLPAAADDWSEAVLRDVLLHELCHIKRLDWITSLVSYLIACALWINPLVWFAVRRLHEASENSCDAAVLRTGRAGPDYAESLLGVATGCIHARRSRLTSQLLVQTMHDRNTLKQRISRVLEENVMSSQESKRSARRTLAAVVMLSVAMMGIVGSHQVLKAQEQPNPDAREVDQEMIPLNTVEPMYPKQAADEGIEGWVHVRFTVTADGMVDSESVRVLDAEPAYTFDHTAVAATKQFRFRPRVVAGQAVDVPNVQYVFRYQLQNPDAAQ